jgi:hypothetical protein
MLLHPLAVRPYTGSFNPHRQYATLAAASIVRPSSEPPPTRTPCPVRIAIRERSGPFARPQRLLAPSRARHVCPQSSGVSKSFTSTFSTPCISPSPAHLHACEIAAFGMAGCTAVHTPSNEIVVPLSVRHNRRRVIVLIAGSAPNRCRHELHSRNAERPRVFTASRESAACTAP